MTDTTTEVRCECGDEVGLDDGCLACLSCGDCCECPDDLFDALMEEGEW